MIAWSVGVPSSVTRIVLYTVPSFRAAWRSSTRDDVPGRFQRDRQAQEVHDGDQERAPPTTRKQQPAVTPRTHPLAGAGEVKQREHGERELEAQHHLTQNQ